MTGCLLLGLGADRAVPIATAVVLYRDFGGHRSLLRGDGRMGALALILARCSRRFNLATPDILNAFGLGVLYELRPDDS